MLSVTYMFQFISIYQPLKLILVFSAIAVFHLTTGNTVTKVM